MEFVCGVEFFSNPPPKKIDYFWGFPVEQLRRLLQNSCHSLDEVSLNEEICTCNEILDICPNLERLHYEACSVPSQQSQPQSKQQYPSLKCLYVDTTAKTQLRDFEQALKRLTNLQEIVINMGDVNLDLLRLIH